MAGLRCIICTGWWIGINAAAGRAAANAKATTIVFFMTSILYQILGVLLTEMFYVEQSCWSTGF
jgi:hypothetical protein